MREEGNYEREGERVRENKGTMKELAVDQSTEVERGREREGEEWQRLHLLE
jgi:hypothetical protein